MRHDTWVPAGRKGDVSQLSSPAGLPVRWRPPAGLLTWLHVPGHAPGQVRPGSRYQDMRSELAATATVTRPTDRTLLAMLGVIQASCVISSHHQAYYLGCTHRVMQPLMRSYSPHL